MHQYVRSAITGYAIRMYDAAAEGDRQRAIRPVVERFAEQQPEILVIPLQHEIRSIGDAVVACLLDQGVFDDAACVIGDEHAVNSVRRQDVIEQDTMLDLGRHRRELRHGHVVGDALQRHVERAHQLVDLVRQGHRDIGGGLLGLMPCRRAGVELDPSDEDRHGRHHGEAGIEQRERTPNGLRGRQGGVGQGLLQRERRSSSPTVRGLKEDVDRRGPGCFSRFPRDIGLRQASTGAGSASRSRIVGRYRSSPVPRHPPGPAAHR